jgi:hypothetical protein
VGCHVFGQRDPGGFLGALTHNDDPATLPAHPDTLPGHKAGMGQEVQRLGFHLRWLADAPHGHDSGPFDGQVDNAGDTPPEVLVRLLPQLVEPRDRVAIGAFAVLADQRQDLALDPLAHDVLPPAGLVMHVLPFKADDVEQQALSKSMLAHDPRRELTSLVRQLDVAVALNGQQTVSFHPGHRLGDGWTRVAETLGDSGSQRDCALLLELEDRPEVHLSGVNQVRHAHSLSLIATHSPVRREPVAFHLVSESFVVPARFCGPPMSGNGGWTSGHLAQLVDGALEGGAVTVRLRTPPPLDTEMAISRGDDGTVEVWDGQTLVAQAFAAEPLDPTELCAPVTYARAEAAGPAYEGLRSHPFPTCFTCGTSRDPSDALCLHTGLLAGHTTLRAAAWTPRESSPELVWAALDCPGAWASGIAGREMVLGTMTATVHDLPLVAEPHVVMAWPRGHEGRKYYSGTALYAAHGRLLARADAVWISVDASTVRPA